jgi:hypothetical protein
MRKILPSEHKRNMLIQLRGVGPASAAILETGIFTLDALWRYVEIGLVPAGAVSCAKNDAALEAAAV